MLCADLGHSLSPGWNSDAASCLHSLLVKPMPLIRLLGGSMPARKAGAKFLTELDQIKSLEVADVSAAVEDSQANGRKQ